MTFWFAGCCLKTLKPRDIGSLATFSGLRVSFQTSTTRVISLYAAQTGFSFSGGTAKPVEEGIVVCKEFADVIKEVCAGFRACVRAVRGNLSLPSVKAST